MVFIVSPVIWDVKKLHPIYLFEEAMVLWDITRFIQERRFIHAIGHPLRCDRQPELLLKNVWPISQFSSQDNFDNVERIKDNLANSPLVTITWVIVRSSNESVRRALPNLRYVWTKRRSRFEVEQTLSSQSIECLRDPNMQHIQKTNGQALQLHGLHGLLKRLPPIACLWKQMC